MALRIRQVLLPAGDGCFLDEIVDYQRVGVAIASHRVGRPLCGSRDGPAIGVDGTRVNVQMVGVTSGGIEVGILRSDEAKSTRHAQQVRDAYRVSRIARL